MNQRCNFENHTNSRLINRTVNFYSLGEIFSESNWKINSKVESSKAEIFTAGDSNPDTLKIERRKVNVDHWSTEDLNFQKELLVEYQNRILLK